MARPEGAQAFLRPSGSKRQSRAASHTKTLKMRVSRNFQLSPLPKIGEGFGEWSEAFLARKVGWSVKVVLGIAERMVSKNQI